MPSIVVLGTLQPPIRLPSYRDIDVSVVICVGSVWSQSKRGLTSEDTSRSGIATLEDLPFLNRHSGPSEGRKRLSAASASSTRSVGGGGGGGEGGAAGSESSSTELVGKEAEERGQWLTALRATVCTVRCASRFVPAFVQDFESAGGYETVAYMVRRSAIERLPAMLEQVHTRGGRGVHGWDHAGPLIRRGARCAFLMPGPIRHRFCSDVFRATGFRARAVLFGHGLGRE